VPVLLDPAARAGLAEVLAGVDRLVLLGDTLELRAGAPSRVLDVARPVLAQLGAALGPDSEVVIVPGNHDHRLLRTWRERRAAVDGSPSLGLENAVDWSEGEPLALLADVLEGPARVRAFYPGVWLRQDVYAIHGHYLDVHITVPIMERLGAGLMSRLLRSQGAGDAEAYEAVLGPMYAWVDSVAEAGAGAGLGLQGRVWSGLQRGRRRRSLRQHSMALALPLAVAALNRAGLGPLKADLSGPELRRAGLSAFGQVLGRLGVQAGHVIFGHTHRAGPLPGDEPGEWRSTTRMSMHNAGISMHNTGSWVYAPFFLGPSPPQSPYRPGFAYLVEDQGPPELVNLLDGRWRPPDSRAT
jgi:hypothetical protein